MGDKGDSDDDAKRADKGKMISYEDEEKYGWDNEEDINTNLATIANILMPLMVKFLASQIEKNNKDIVSLLPFYPLLPFSSFSSLFLYL